MKIDYFRIFNLISGFLPLVLACTSKIMGKSWVPSNSMGLIRWARCSGLGEAPDCLSCACPKWAHLASSPRLHPDSCKLQEDHS